MVVTIFVYQIQGLLLTALLQNSCIFFIRHKISAFLNFSHFIFQDLGDFLHFVLSFYNGLPL